VASHKISARDKGESRMKDRPHLIPALIAAIISGGYAIPVIRDMLLDFHSWFPFPVTRWIIFGVAVYIAFKALQWRKLWAAVVFGLVALYFSIWFFIRGILLRLGPEFIFLLPEYDSWYWYLSWAIPAVLFVISIFTLKEPAKLIELISTSPMDGQEVPNLTPELSWTPWTGAIKYNLQVSADVMFNSLLINEMGLTTNKYSVPPNTLERHATFFWRVDAQTDKETIRLFSQRFYTPKPEPD
jgi:hypothetical protein